LENKQELFRIAYGVFVSVQRISYSVERFISV